MPNQKKSETTGLEVAVIGMAGRFPGASNITAFWENLKNGVESISFFSDAELEAAGVEREVYTSPNYIKAKGIIDQAEYFDANFFGYGPKDAQMLDPQVRVFYECVWEALEDAGYNPYAYPGLIGLYAGASTNYFWEAANLAAINTPGAISDGDTSEQFARMQLVDNKFLPTRISYQLNLKGPSVFVYTACSTSLMAVHMACRALLTGECQIALAGGVTLMLPQRSGYLYQEGMITSPDGHCRAFDARAGGTVWGEGAGVVALKMLKNALADGDHIYAVVKGTAINNDGLRKVGFTAPSIEGQADVIRAAQRMARVEPESVSYIEAHGTGTVLGDPIEIEALRIAFRTDKKQFCRIGSVKTNIGHLDSAAGIAGFMKTVLALHHRQIPPSLHYETPNPKIDFANGPFTVNTRLTDWTHESYPLRAGVSAFGIGGTNAHVVLEQAPPVPAGPNAGAFHETPAWEDQRETPRQQLIVFSAKTETALSKIAANLADYLQKNPGTNLADFSYTLSVGRAHLPYRGFVVSDRTDNAVRELSKQMSATPAPEDEPDLIFMFPGQGSQYPNMGRELYETQAPFRDEINRCSELLKPILNLDLVSVLYPESGEDNDNRRIYETALTQPVIFSVEYALAVLLMKWGLKPRRMIGHSIGEYVAACLAGVFSLEDALTLVAWRGKLMQEMEEGAMLSVPLSETELAPWLGPDLSLAAVNGPSLCVVSGPKPAIAALEEQLQQKQIHSVRLQVSHAFHSAMMEPALARFSDQVKRIRLSAPQIPYVSCVTGTWIAGEEATDPDYWVRHLRNTVRFAGGVTKLLETGRAVMIEAGGGRTLTGLAKEQPAFRLQNHFIFNAMRHPREDGSDLRQLLTMMGQLWRLGISPDWNEFYASGRRRRISLPTYPFERRHFWIDQKINAIRERITSPKDSPRKRDLDDWFYMPIWNRVNLSPGVNQDPPGNTLVFINETGFGLRITETLRQTGSNLILVKTGAEFRKESADCYFIQPDQPEDYRKLFRDLKQAGRFPQKMIHLWLVTKVSLKGNLSGNLSEGSSRLDFKQIEAATDRGFYSLIHIAQAIGELKITDEVCLKVVTNDMQSVTGAEMLSPEKATVLGPIGVIPREYPNIKCGSIDIEIPEESDESGEAQLLKDLIPELSSHANDATIAWRGGTRWVRGFKPIQLKQVAGITFRLRQNGVYLITGGLGGIGLAIAEFLVKSVQAGVVLTGRTALPPKPDWEQWLQEHEKEDHTSQKIRKLRGLEELGGKVLAAEADVSDPEQMKRV